MDNGEHRRLLEAFLAAARNGDVAELEQLLAADAISYADGGGIRNASRIPVAGRTRIALFMKSFAPRFWTGSTITLTEANGRPAAVVSRDGVAFVMLNIAASADGIDRLLWVMNPDKLARISTWASEGEFGLELLGDPDALFAGGQGGGGDAGQQPGGEDEEVPAEAVAGAAVHQVPDAVDRVAHREHVVEEVQRCRDRLPGEGTARADQLDHHQDQAEELADGTEPGGQRVQDRHEGDRRQHQEADGQPGMRGVDPEPEDHRGEDERGLDRAEDGRRQPTAERYPERRLQCGEGAR